MSHHEARTVRVWDPFVRLFHWSLVAIFAVAYLTGDEESALHVYAGYGLLTLIAARIAWGLVGTRHARFSDFVHGPKVVRDYLRDILRGRPRHYLGHNPLGGLMILALLLSLLVTGLSGLALQGAEEGEGPLASWFVSVGPLVSITRADDDEERKRHGDAAEAVEELHEAAANLTMLLVVLHIAGVLLGSLIHRENLIGAMISGNKRL